MVLTNQARRVGSILIALILLATTLAVRPPAANAAAPAAPLKDIYPGSSSSSPTGLTLFNGAVFFSARDGTSPTSSGYALWKTDGSAAGTVKVKDVEPLGLTVFDGALYFLAQDGTSAMELWKSDGSAAGTSRLKRAVPATSGIISYPNLTVAGNLLFFAAGTELWKSDGTAAGTLLVKDTAPGGATEGLDHLTAIGNRLLFPGVGGGGLWVSDGTTAGTVLIKEPGSLAQDNEFIPFNSADGSSVQIGGVLYFAAFTSAYQTELWRSDGTAAGTWMVKDINPGGETEGGSWPRNMTAIGKTLFFTTYDINDLGGCSNSFNLQQSGLWASDGTAAGTVRLSSGPKACLTSRYYNAANVGGTLYYTDNTALYKSDGTPQGTVLVREQFQNPNQLAGGPIGNALGTALFNVYDPTTQGLSLWRSDGTQAGTAFLQTVSTGTVNAAPDNFTILGNTLLFTADDGVSGDELWSAYLPDLLRASAPVTAAGGGKLSSTDGRVQVSFPAGAVASDVTLSLAPLAAPGHPLGERSSVRGFVLEARDSGGNLVTRFGKPYTLTISYSAAEMAGLFEPGLNLSYWNGAAWVNLLPCAGCVLDMANHRITVRLDHFTEFALVGDTRQQVFVPLAAR